ncbi:ThiF family adenylyltransferase [Metallibacterium sp.]|jgi:integrative and conjugative element protein (TIGR02256 family)|uniref:ThiF family adenylyltransferase n=1 Tax=Metallibacterium sp. TaxID=2940281 RepID=UPI00260DAD5C|nr:ThiF family adenylyltransferase [Metallibacterium sp.]
MTLLDDAICQLRRHRGVERVGDPFEVQGAIHIEIDIPVELPSRSRPSGVSATGVRTMETCTLVFKHGWPLRAPRPYLRADFPLDLPHINPHSPGQLVSPCVFEGSLDELLHRFGLDAIVDQVIEWLASAAAGTLIDLTQGWEPTRRDTCPSTIVFSAERVDAAAPNDGSILITAAGYVTVDGGLYAYVNRAVEAQSGLIFKQTPEGEPSGVWASGRCAAFIARAPIVEGQPRVVAKYSPETVVDLDSLFARAADLGVNREALAQALDNYYQRSIFDQAQDARLWTRGFYAIVILAVQRPAVLVGSPGRSVEVLPYVVRYEIDAKAPLERNASVHPAFHAHALSPELLARASGHPVAATNSKVVLLGCGSLGSKLGLHLGRGGFGKLTFVDNKAMSPHNLARHALVDELSALLPPNKAEHMKAAFAKLSHAEARAANVDAVSVLTDATRFADAVPEDVALILDASASLQVLVAASRSALLAGRAGRLARTALYGQGRCAVLMLEGPGRGTRVDDLDCLLFEHCRANPEIRAAIAGDSTEPTRIFVGDNCRSLTMPMSDAVLSRSAAPMAIQIERWLISGFPPSAQLCIGVADTAGLAMTWAAIPTLPATAIPVAEDGGWEVRVLPAVAGAIDTDARRWEELETGGALIGKVSYECRTITIAGLVDAPPDSVRRKDRFILDTNGLVQALRKAHADSLGHLMFVGTWHSHPGGGPHSGLDRDTLRKIATDAEGLPVVSLVWTPTGLRCAVDHW